MTPAAPGATLEREPAELARSALAIAHSQPLHALRLASSARDRAGEESTRSVAEQALGLAAKQRDDLDAALGHLRAAARHARHAGEPERLGEVQVSLCYVLLSRGEIGAALREADQAAQVLRGPSAARLQMRRALILQRMGRDEEALEGYRRALSSLRKYEDTEWEARLLCNRGVLHTYRGEFGRAEHDLLRAEALHRALGPSAAAAEVRHNLGFLAARRGDVPLALAWYDAAEEEYRALGVFGWAGCADRCELLLAARLTDEARSLAERAVAALERGHASFDLAEARLALAQAALLQGDHEVARRSSEAARRAFQSQHRPGWAALASFVSLRADWMSGERSAALLGRAQRVTGRLRGAGWIVPTLDARLMAARTALALQRPRTARSELSAARLARWSGPLELRARAWHAEALLRLADGNRRGAESALRAGLAVVFRMRAALGASELRAHVAEHANDLAALGLRLAIESRNPARVLQWAERWRAGALHHRPLRPPADEKLVAELAALREAVAQVETAALGGADTGRLLRRQVMLERAIQRRTRQAPGDGRQDVPRMPSARELAEHLGEQVLVELVRLDGTLHAVVQRDRRLTLRTLGSAALASDETEALHFALRRLAVRRSGAAGLAAARAAAAHACERLDEVLLRPVADLLGDRPVVIVPTGELHALPWPLLPSVRGRAVSIVPSARLWLAARAQGRALVSPPRGVSLVGCTEPAQAVAEIREVALAYPGASLIVDEDATVSAVLGAVDGTDLAHLACHGSFRADQPLFSSLQLADGPLTVYDLERLRQAPRLLVLSACESGLSRVTAGDEVMGLASALFSAGTSTLVASVAPVPDECTKELMVAFHRNLSGGATPAAALAAAQRDAGGGEVSFEAGTFVCFGAG